MNNGLKYGNDANMHEMSHINGERIFHYCLEIAKLPTTQMIVGGSVAYILGNMILKNHYSATADFGHIKFSLMKD